MVGMAPECFGDDTTACAEEISMSEAQRISREITRSDGDSLGMRQLGHEVSAKAGGCKNWCRARAGVGRAWAQARWRAWGEGGCRAWGEGGCRAKARLRRGRSWGLINGILARRLGLATTILSRFPPPVSNRSTPSRVFSRMYRIRVQTRLRDSISSIATFKHSSYIARVPKASDKP